MKKKIKYLLLFFVMLAVMPVTANAASDKSNVNKVISNYMKAAKKFDTNKMNKYVSKKSDKITKQAVQKTPYAVKFVKQVNKRISYKITKTTVKGKNATVKIKMTYVDTLPVTDYMVDQMMSDAAAGKGIYSDYSSMFDTDKLLAYTDSLYGKALDQNFKLKTKTKTITVKLTKSGKDWKFKDMKKSNAKFWDIVNGAVGETMEKSKQKMSYGGLY